MKAGVTPRLSRPSIVGLRRNSSLHRVIEDPATHRVEELGLFLRVVLHEEVQSQPEAVERMVRDGTEPPRWVLETLLAGDDAAARVVDRCSAAELCVLLDTLDAFQRNAEQQLLTRRLAPLAPATAITDQTIAATSDIQFHARGQAPLPPPSSFSVYTAFRDRLLAAAQASGRCNDGDDFSENEAVALRASVIASLAARHHSQRAASLLLDALRATGALSALPLLCVEQLRGMLARGACPTLAAVQELASTAAQTALAQSFQRMPEARARELMLELGRAATASLATDLIALWTALRTAAIASGSHRSLVGDAPAGSGASLPAAKAEKEEEEAPEIEAFEIDIGGGDDDDKRCDPLARGEQDARKFAQSMQRLMRSSTLAAAAFSQRTLDQLAATARGGADLSAEALQEVGSRWHSVRQAMTCEELEETTAQLRRLADRQRQQHADEWRALLEKTQRAATDAARLGELAVRAQNVEFYESHCRAARNVGSALSDKIRDKQREAKRVADAWSACSQLEVEAAYDAAARGADVARTASFGWLRYLKSKLPSLSKVEILRDFAQTISLVFTNLYTNVLASERLSDVQRTLETWQAAYRSFFNVVAADFTAMFLRFHASERAPDVLFAALLLAIAIACVGLLGIVFMVVRRVDKRMTDAAATDAQRKRRKTFIWRVTAVLTVCQSVHLPVARLSTEILLGSRETSSVWQRYRDKWYWPQLHTAAIVLLVGYVPGLVVLLMFLIHTNAPTVSAKSPDPSTRGLRQRLDRLTKSKHLDIVDLDGVAVPFHNSVYAEILRRDPAQLLCPYRSLYASFEHRWRYYKVVQLTMKVALTMLLIPIRDPRLRAVTTLCVTALSFLSTWTAPFIDDFDDKMEFSAKLTACVTCIGGVVLAYEPTSESRGIATLSKIVNVVNAFNAVFLALVTLFGTDGMKIRIKSGLQRLTFSNSERYAANQPPEKALPDWNVDHEIRHRVWHAFWKRLLLSLGEHAAIQRLAHAKTEEEQEVAAAKKVQAAAAEPTQKHHWAGQVDEAVKNVRVLTRSLLEGPDVFYETETRAGFGHLAVVPCPFHCVFQYDGHDRGTVQIVDDHDVAALLFANFRCDVVKKRVLRQKIRALSEWGRAVALPYERDEAYTETQNATASRPFRCRYTNGVVVVAAECPRPPPGEAMTTGLSLSIEFSDGAGDVLCPDTGEVLHRITGHACRVTGGDALALLGLTPAFDTVRSTSPLDQIFAQPPVQAALASLLPQIQARQHDERERTIERQLEADAVLSSGFRFAVYNNPHLPRRELERFLVEEETNANLQKAALTRRAALDALYERLHFIYSDRRVAFWYLFWHDVYEQNGHDIAALHGYRRQLDPEEPASICYEVMPRDALQRWLARRGLWGERHLPWRWRRVLFYDKILDLLYEHMERQREGDGGSGNGGGADSRDRINTGELHAW